MKRIHLFALFTLSLFTNSQENLIQLVDDQGNKSYFPESFIRQNEVIGEFIELNPAAELYELPPKTTVKKLNELYIDSLLDFENIPLRNLVEYFVYADQLGNETLLTQLKQIIFEKLQNTSVTNDDKGYAREILSFYLAKSKLESENIDIPLLLEKTNVPKKNLVPAAFQQILQQQFKQKYPTYQNINIIFALIQSLPDSTFDNYYLILKKGNNLSLAKTKADPAFNFLEIQNEFEWLEKHHWEVNTFWNFFNKFPYEEINLLTYSNDYKILTFAVPGKLLIAPEFMHFTSSGVLISNTSSKYKPRIIKLNTINPYAVCSHIAFSFNNEKISCIVDKKPYLVDIETNKITPIDIPADIFSSILITDSILLLRTTNGNTYAYNLKTNQLTYLPDVDIDYFTVSYLENNRASVFGFKQATDPQGKLIIEKVSESIDLINLGTV